MPVKASQLRAWGTVAAQGLLFAAVAVTALVDAPPRLPTVLWLALVLILVGAAGVIATGTSLGASLTPSPVPNEAGLVGSGLYRWARHPMYSALVVICLGVAVGSGSAWCYAAVGVLCVFFAFKARLEERYLLTAYDGYRDYAAVTGRFVPKIGRLRS
ncbi:methyltransferase family protein [Demequina sp.]|uniref:methyltransferase family protein n=1 Tax=Demequina sp. TaxID=2050685 RepID=UPI003A89C3C2